MVKDSRGLELIDEERWYELARLAVEVGKSQVVSRRNYYGD